MPFVKLDCGILDSSLWPMRPERELFITALLMAVPKVFDEPMPQLELNSFEPTGFVVPPGEYGFIEASWIGVVERCKLEVTAKTEEAMRQLGNLDLWSRSDEFEGRRLIRVRGGLIVLNYMKYREKDRTAAERMKRYRERQKEPKALRNGDVASVTNRNAVTQAEAEAEADIREEPLFIPLEGEKSASPPKKRKSGPSRPLSAEEVKAYVCGELKLPENDALALWEHWRGNGFTNRGKAIKDWKATASNWERRGIFFPSLQDKNRKSAFGFAP